MRIVDPRDILISPVVSEKAYGLLDQNKYTFIVSPDANKTQIKIAVEEVFGVKVTSVNTMNREGSAYAPAPDLVARLQPSVRLCPSPLAIASTYLADRSPNGVLGSPRNNETRDENGYP